MRFDFHSLTNAYQSGQLQPVEVVRAAYSRIRQQGERPVWIHLIPEQESIRRAEALGPYRESLPLYGIPFAIKDNIDLALVPTTAGCPAYAYTPAESATVVARLVAAGAIPVGKTNLDQFATGLVGTRSPYGACSSVFDDKYISGGSSSGSAVAVAAGLVSFSLGTDTAGSGRVPAAFNNIVGLKATCGAISTAGVVPACRTLDCVSVFAQTCGDAARVLDVAGGFDAMDDYSRTPGQSKAWPQGRFRFGAPAADQLQFFGDAIATQMYRDAIARMESLGGIRHQCDFALFGQVAQLLYAGPWVAERYAALRLFLMEHQAELHPVTAKIIAGAASISAADAFDAMYRLAALRRETEKEWGQMDFLFLPTAGTHYTQEQVAADPIRTNTDLGHYTNFVNLLDLAAVAVPAGIRGDGLPFGVTLIGPAWSEASLLQTADSFHRSDARAMTGANLAPLHTLPQSGDSYAPPGYAALAVCGAHLTGQPLNRQLTDAGAFLIEACRTAPEYKLYALAGTTPPKPGLVRTARGGAAIEVEVWAVPEARFGAFVTAVPAPLGIGSCTLASKRVVKSFSCEPAALAGAEDITSWGGWRAYMAARAAGPAHGQDSKHLLDREPEVRRESKHP